MTQAGVVARLAVRELWISFRLFMVVAVFVAAGAVVALVPGPLPTTMARLAAGLAAGTLAAAAVAAWSMAEERRAGRAGWLVSRSLPRGTLLTGWFAALSVVSLVALAAAGTLGWLAATSVALRLEPGGFAALLAGVAATTLLAIALGLLVGTLLGARLAAFVAVGFLVLAGSIAWAAPLDATILPGGAHVALARLTEGTPEGPGLRATGAALAGAAVLLAVARATIERAEL